MVFLADLLTLEAAQFRKYIKECYIVGCIKSLQNCKALELYSKPTKKSKTEASNKEEVWDTNEIANE